MAGRWGPDRKQAAVSFTFDNLGEASDIEFGRWPTDRPVGSHHSAVRDLPAILDVVTTKMTFFIESWNLHVYPNAVRSVAEAGHEIGCHGMRHEIWCHLTAEQELDHLKRCQDDYARFGIEILGLRPPGGIAAPHSGETLAEVGMTYISPIGVPAGVLDSGVAVMPVVQASTDVAFYSTDFARYRSFKPSAEPLTPEDMVEGVTEEVEKVIDEGGFMSNVCHPFYQSPTPDRTDPSRIEAIGELVRRLTADERIWHAPCSEIADWMRAHREEFPAPASLDPPEWWNPSFYKDIKRKL